MTEAEWLACKEPRLMLEFLRGDFVCKDTRLPSGEVTPAWEYANSEVNDRRLRLFTVVCCEILGCLFPKQRTVFKRIELCARMGEMPEHVVTTHAGALELAGTGSEDHEALKRRIAKLKQFTGQALAEYITRVPPTSRTGKELEATSLRDIFGNPFRPLPPRPEAIAPLAEQIYAGEWNLMPLLGEWLQEHGYWSEGEHCLDPNIPHVKGCWAVDWVLGRE